MTASEIVFAVRNVWGLDTAPFVVVTGGEPTLQLDAHLVDELHVQLGATVALETNGSLPFPDAVDWVCVSPKPPVAVAVTRVDEVKVLYPLFDPLSYENLAPIRTVQPVDGDPGSLQKCIDFVLKHPGWKLGLQCHKVWGVQ